MLKIWWMAIRPKTLSAALSPVLIGSALAWQDGVFHYPSVVAAMLGALWIQIGTNFANDYFDFKQGKDTEKRLGPTRVTSAGLVSAEMMKRAMIIAFLLSIVSGLYIMFRGGFPIVIIGILSILFGIAYTGGPYPLGYNGLGDVFVLIFFGPVAVGGTYYVQALTVTPEILVIGLAPGLLATAILAVNNLRDADEDRETGKRTLAVRFGKTFAKWEYVVCVLGAIALVGRELPGMYGLLILAVPLIVQVFRKTGRDLNTVLGKTGLLMVVFSVLFVIFMFKPL